jgi:MFS family permease
MTETKQKTMYTKSFFLLSASMFCFMLSINVIIPQFNEMLEDLDGAAYKAFIIGAFTFVAGISRPFSGKIADNVSRKSVIYFGILVSAICSLIYPFITSIALFFVVRLIHGFSTGFQPTGTTAIVTDTAHPERRGEIMGVFGVVISLGMGTGLYLSTPIYNLVGLENLFFISSGFAIVAFILSLLITESLENRVKLKFEHIRIKKNEIIDRDVLLPSIVMFLTASCAGVVFTITPDMGNYLDIENKGYFFGVYVSFTIVIRFLAGKFSDKWGRRNSLKVGVFLLGCAMLITGLAPNKTVYFIGAALYGISSGIGSPTIFAWTADLANPKYRGRGIGTMFIALEVGILFGSMICFTLYNDTKQTAEYTFIGGAISCFLAVAMLFLIKKDRPFAKSTIE